MEHFATTAQILLIITGHQAPPIQTKPVINTPAIVKSIPLVAPMELSKPLEPVSKLETLPVPIAPTGTYQNDYEWGNCTEYVASRINVPNSMGDANQWDYTLNSVTPQVGAIAQSKRGVWGHVAVVEEVSGDMVRVSEMNVLGLGVISEAWHPISYYDNFLL